MNVFKKVKNMSKETIEFKRLNVEGVPPELFHQFKLICVERQITIKKVVHSFLEAYVKSALEEFKKKRNRVV